MSARVLKWRTGCLLLGMLLVGTMTLRPLTWTLHLLLPQQLGLPEMTTLGRRVTAPGVPETCRGFLRMFRQMLMLRLALRLQLRLRVYSVTWVRVLTVELAALVGKCRWVTVRRFPSMSAPCRITLVSGLLTVMAWAMLAALLRHRLLSLISSSEFTPVCLPSCLAGWQRGRVLRLPVVLTALNERLPSMLAVLWKVLSPVMVLPLLGGPTRFLAVS